jgi:hypothetical protein
MRQIDIKMSQVQIGKDIRVELQIPPSAYLNLRGAEKIPRLEREKIWRHLFQNVNNFINENGGRSTIVNPISERLRD